MNKHNIIFALVGLLAGFFIGFFIANNVVTSDPVAVAPKPAPAAKGDNGQTPAANSPGMLRDEEIREVIATADAKPENTDLQRNLGLALYRYSTQIQDARYLPDVARLLRRAHEATPDDRDLLISLGNVLFDLGQQSEPERIKEARTYYQKALVMKADDADVRTDLGLTYYLAKPSEPERAIAEYRKSLAIDARHEPTLQHLAAALIATRKLKEAEQRIKELESLNSSSPALSNLRAQLEQSKYAEEQP